MSVFHSVAHFSTVRSYVPRYPCSVEVESPAPAFYLENSISLLTFIFLDYQMWKYKKTCWFNGVLSNLVAKDCGKQAFGTLQFVLCCFLRLVFMQLLCVYCRLQSRKVSRWWTPRDTAAERGICSLKTSGNAELNTSPPTCECTNVAILLILRYG